MGLVNINQQVLLYVATWDLWVGTEWVAGVLDSWDENERLKQGLVFGESLGPVAFGHDIGKSTAEGYCETTRSMSGHGMEEHWVHKRACHLLSEETLGDLLNTRMLG